MQGDSIYSAEATEVRWHSEGYAVCKVTQCPLLLICFLSLCPHCGIRASELESEYSLAKHLAILSIAYLLICTIHSLEFQA